MKLIVPTVNRPANARTVHVHFCLRAYEFIATKIVNPPALVMNAPITVNTRRNQGTSGRLNFALAGSYITEVLREQRGA